MKRQICVLLAMCMIFGLTGCTQKPVEDTSKTDGLQSEMESSSQGTESSSNSENTSGKKVIDLTHSERELLDREAMTEVEYDFELSEIVIEEEPLGTIETHIFVESKCYYIISFASYYQSFLDKGQEAPAFQKEHSTKLYCYDIITGEKICLYEYEEPYAVGTSLAMMYDADCLTWIELNRDEKGKNAWYRRTFHLADGTTTQEPGSSLKKDAKTEGEYVYEDVVTTYMHGNEWSKITIDNQEQTTEMGVAGLVDGAISNGKICVWMAPSTESIHVYDLINDKYLKLDIGYISLGHFCIYEDWLLFASTKGLIAYDIPNNRCVSVMNEKLNTFFTVPDSEGVYALIGNGFMSGGMKILHIQ